MDRDERLAPPSVFHPAHADADDPSRQVREVAAGKWRESMSLRNGSLGMLSEQQFRDVLPVVIRAISPADSPEDIRISHGIFLVQLIRCHPSDHGLQSLFLPWDTTFLGRIFLFEGSYPLKFVAWLLLHALVWRGRSPRKIWPKGMHPTALPRISEHVPRPTLFDFDDFVMQLPPTLSLNNMTFDPHKWFHDGAHILAAVQIDGKQLSTPCRLVSCDDRLTLLAMRADLPEIIHIPMSNIEHIAVHFPTMSNTMKSVEEAVQVNHHVLIRMKDLDCTHFENWEGKAAREVVMTYQGEKSTFVALCQTLRQAIPARSMKVSSSEVLDLSQRSDFGSASHVSDSYPRTNGPPALEPDSQRVSPFVKDSVEYEPHNAGAYDAMTKPQRQADIGIGYCEQDADNMAHSPNETSGHSSNRRAEPEGRNAQLLATRVIEKNAGDLAPQPSKDAPCDPQAQVRQRCDVAATKLAPNVQWRTVHATDPNASLRFSDPMRELNPIATNIVNGKRRLKDRVNASTDQLSAPSNAPLNGTAGALLKGGVRVKVLSSGKRQRLNSPTEEIKKAVNIFELPQSPEREHDEHPEGHIVGHKSTGRDKRTKLQRPVQQKTQRIAPQNSGPGTKPVDREAVVACKMTKTGAVSMGTNGPPSTISSNSGEESHSDYDPSQRLASTKFRHRPNTRAATARIQQDKPASPPTEQPQTMNPPQLRPTEHPGASQECPLEVLSNNSEPSDGEEMSDENKPIEVSTKRGTTKVAFRLEAVTKKEKQAELEDHGDFQDLEKLEMSFSKKGLTQHFKEPISLLRTVNPLGGEKARAKAKPAKLGTARVTPKHITRTPIDRGTRRPEGTEALRHEGLVDDEHAKKAPIISFAREGPRNQGALPVATTPHLSSAVRTVGKSTRLAERLAAKSGEPYTASPTKPAAKTRKMIGKMATIEQREARQSIAAQDRKRKVDDAAYSNLDAKARRVKTSHFTRDSTPTPITGRLGKEGPDKSDLESEMSPFDDDSAIYGAAGVLQSNHKPRPADPREPSYALTGSATIEQVEEANAAFDPTRQDEDPFSSPGRSFDLKSPFIKHLMKKMKEGDGDDTAAASRQTIIEDHNEPSMTEDSSQISSASHPNTPGADIASDEPVDKLALSFLLNANTKLKNVHIALENVATETIRGLSSSERIIDDTIDEYRSGGTKLIELLRAHQLRHYDGAARKAAESMSTFELERAKELELVHAEAEKIVVKKLRKLWQQRQETERKVVENIKRWTEEKLAVGLDRSEPLQPKLLPGEDPLDEEVDYDDVNIAGKERTSTSSG